MEPSIPIKEEWQEWMSNPCTKRLLFELEEERKGLLEVTARGTKEDFESNQGCIKEIDFVIKCINEKGG